MTEHTFLKAIYDNIAAYIEEVGYKEPEAIPYKVIITKPMADALKEEELCIPMEFDSTYYEEEYGDVFPYNKGPFLLPIIVDDIPEVNTPHAIKVLYHT